MTPARGDQKPAHRTEKASGPSCNSGWDTATPSRRFTAPRTIIQKGHHP